MICIQVLIPFTPTLWHFIQRGCGKIGQEFQKILTELEPPKIKFQSFVPQKQSSIFNLRLLLDKFGLCVTNDFLLHQGLGLIQKCYHQHKIFHPPLNVLVYFIIAKLHTPKTQTHTHNTFMNLQKRKKNTVGGKSGSASNSVERQYLPLKNQAGN